MPHAKSGSGDMCAGTDRDFRHRQRAADKAAGFAKIPLPCGFAARKAAAAALGKTFPAFFCKEKADIQLRLELNAVEK